MHQKEYSLRKRPPNRKADTQKESPVKEENLPEKEDSLRKRLPTRKTDPNSKSKTQQEQKTDTQMATHQSNRKTCRRVKTRGENAFPTGRLTPKWQITNPAERYAPERRLLKKMSSQQEGRHPKRKSPVKAEDLPQKEGSSRKCFANKKIDTPKGNHEPNRKTCPRSLPNRKADTSTANYKPNKKSCPRKQTH